MTISQIYANFKIPKNLQNHMCEVAALSQILTDGWIGKPINKKAILQSCLLHDLAKPIDFDLTKQAQFGLTKDGIINLTNFQNLLKSKYANNEYDALVKIGQELGCQSDVIQIIKNFDWHNVPTLINNNALESLICIYCDMRISPKGMLPLIKRILEAKSRNKSSQYDKHLKYAKELEQIITVNASINIQAISKDQIEAKLKNLLQEVIP